MMPAGREGWVKIILGWNIALILLSILVLGGLFVWDLTSGHQTVTGRCVWASGFCLWIGSLSSLGICLIFLTVNLLAVSGIVRASSWHNKYPDRAYQLLYPWLFVYFILNTAILPIGIVLVYMWYEGAPPVCTLAPPRPPVSSHWLPTVCQGDILRLWAPLAGVLTVIVLVLSLHNWFIILRLASSLKDKMRPTSFTRIGSRVVLGLLDTSHGDHSGSSSSLGRGTSLVGRVTPYETSTYF